MSWKVGTKLIASEGCGIEFPSMKGRKAIFVGRFRGTFLRGLVYVKYRRSGGYVIELWHKSYWKRRDKK